MNHPAVESGAFKRTMRHYPTGVTVVTSIKEAEPRGITINAFSSVSAEPPTLLICVNVLAGEQRDLADRF